LTLWAVMGLDDTHWLTDVIVGVPLAVALQWAFVPADRVPQARRWATVVACMVLTVAWLLAIRAGRPLLDLSPMLAWIAVLGTVGWPLSRQLTRARRGVAQQSPHAELRFRGAEETGR
jgi:hypothetical protein